MVSEDRKYAVTTAGQARDIAESYLTGKLDLSALSFGLPEIHDRYNTWNVPVKYKQETVGILAVDAYTAQVNTGFSSDIPVIQARIEKMIKLKGRNAAGVKEMKKKEKYRISPLQNLVIHGRSEYALTKLPAQSVDMVFTSPPYYNARKQYSEYDTYEDYLSMIRTVICGCRRVLMDGKFFILNASHVLVPRSTRSESSKRLAVPFDIHQIFMEEGFEFIDDIIWQKPEGAGWASGRGRRFAADRNPMQYKAVPVSEYVLVYRKKPAALIDHFIRNHPNQELVRESKIADGYEKTNIWYIPPARDTRHPAVFPKELAEKVISYYSFKNDVILDPFGGVGTTAMAAAGLGRRFVTIECSGEYIGYIRDGLDSVNSLFVDASYEYRDYSEYT